MKEFQIQMNLGPQIHYEAIGADFDECRAQIYKLLADDYFEDEMKMPSEISESNIIDYLMDLGYQARMRIIKS